MPLSERRKMLKRGYNRKYYLRNKAFVDRVKLRYGCSSCGYKEHSCALHFNHLDRSTKKADVAKMMANGRNGLKKEIRKCNILCANCHAVNTYNQRQSGEL